MSNNINESIYLGLVEEVLARGVRSKNRTDRDTISIFGAMIELSLLDGFPLLTTKKINFDYVKTELLWFISGSGEIEDLEKYGNPIWKPWKGKPAPYGINWRGFTTFMGDGFDQLGRVIQEIRENPNSRRLVVSAWEPVGIWNNVYCLPPCHYAFQFNVEGRWLDLLWVQRSVDLMVGLPYNIASYSLLLMMVAQVCGLAPRNVVGMFGNVHIYESHISGAIEQMNRTPFDPPRVELGVNVKEIDEFKPDDIVLKNYKCHPFIPFEVIV